MIKIVELSGGVGGARLARGLAAIDSIELTVVVNVGDDLPTHGLHVSPDIDTVLYTLAGIEGPHGWGRRDDTFAFNDELGRFGADNSFQLGDRDLALKVFRTVELQRGRSLSDVTKAAGAALGIDCEVVPATDDELRTTVRTSNGWISFQEYFVSRGHQDEVLEVCFDGATNSRPAPGVVSALQAADLVVIGPSNPPLSIWPILAVDPIRAAVESHPRVTAVSPLIGGKTVKGPADRVMASLGLPAGNQGVVESYRGLIDRLVIDESDRVDAASIEGVDVLAAPTLIKTADSARALAELILAP